MCKSYLHGPISTKPGTNVNSCSVHVHIILFCSCRDNSKMAAIFVVKIHILTIHSWNLDPIQVSLPKVINDKLSNDILNFDLDLRLEGQVVTLLSKWYMHMSYLDGPIWTKAGTNFSWYSVYN